ncbi:unnamed protein product [Schistosoma mattheei]|uniref:Uncharacterized protein n=1 Tax=Schistosoma mattheei TaxID=31246 RepID=A0A3P8JTE2_9TREM|nr:unnamed protein product [Schistosoma mattheei]
MRLHDFKSFLSSIHTNSALRFTPQTVSRTLLSAAVAFVISVAFSNSSSDLFKAAMPFSMSR